MNFQKSSFTSLKLESDGQMLLSSRKVTLLLGPDQHTSFSSVFRARKRERTDSVPCCKFHTPSSSEARKSHRTVSRKYCAGTGEKMG
jgi:hypothetical protein